MFSVTPTLNNLQLFSIAQNLGPYLYHNSAANVILSLYHCTLTLHHIENIIQNFSKTRPLLYKLICIVAVLLFSPKHTRFGPKQCKCNLIWGLLRAILLTKQRFEDNNLLDLDSSAPKYKPF